jgi:hypothetical protein
MRRYMIQRPNSKSNRTKLFRVILHDDWLDWLNTGGPDAIPCVSEHATYGEANVVVSRLNQELRNSTNEPVR